MYGGGGLSGSEARMKRKHEKRNSLPPLDTVELQPLVKLGGGAKRLQAIFGLSLQSTYEKKKKTHSAHFQKILNPFVRHLQLVYFWSLWGFRPRLE